MFSMTEGRGNVNRKNCVICKNQQKQHLKTNKNNKIKEKECWILLTLQIYRSIIVTYETWPAKDENDLWERGVKKVFHKGQP